jgi:hypothetical protein
MVCVKVEVKMNVMKRRWLPWLPLVLLLLVGGLLLVPQVRWPAYGWLRGEAFYQGMPASWWEQEIDQTYVPLLVNPGWGQRPGGWFRLVPPSLWVQAEQWLHYGKRMTTTYMEEAPLLDGDSAALPLLLTLIRSRSAKVRQVAIAGLLAQGKQGAEVLPALCKAVHDPDYEVSQDALGAMNRLTAETASTSPGRLG